uniref:Uncharacterized protein n=1 Tax=Arundo donax TaxID=35708 RepID=A0A0A9DN12_ARUDO
MQLQKLALQSFPGVISPFSSASVIMLQPIPKMRRTINDPSVSQCRHLQKLNELPGTTNQTMSKVQNQRNSFGQRLLVPARSAKP